ncbi:MAG: hypothetical protein LBU70_07120 [Chitinispirillales bacterium]|nr:hypothetical protein [Chitinispirillales bacterium]
MKTNFSFLKNYTLATAAILLSLMTLSFLWFSYNKQRQVHESLGIVARVLRESDKITDYRNLAVDFDDMRVTVIDANGKVLADNKADARTMENHADRPEFIGAQKDGYGEDIRKSETTGKRTMYTAVRLKDGTCVRFAQAVELTYEFLMWLFAPVIVLSFCLAILMFAFAKNRQAEKMRQEFVANVSHELKTPLTSIKGFAELTTMGLVDNIDQIKDYQQKIVFQSARLLATINDILHLSKLETTKPEGFIAVDTTSTAKQIKDALKTVADKKNIIIQVIGSGKVTAEPEPIYHLIYNLVDNGIKYGKPGGFVKITLDGKRIVVSDNGIGIPAEDTDRIFERFYRVDKSRSAERGGTGLGLAIAKHTAQKYGGDITLKSEEGEGTQVIIEFKA